MSPNPGPAVSPARAARVLRARAAEAGLVVEVAVDLAWIYLRRPGFRLGDCWTQAERERSLGKWIAELPRERLLDEAARLLPAVHAGTVRLAKMTNIFNQPAREPLVAAYCLDRDPVVLAAMRALGWEPRFKLNRETFAGRPRGRAGLP